MLASDMEAQQRLLTLPELARRLRLSATWVRNETEAGRLPCLRAGRRTLYSQRAVERALLRRAGAREEGDDDWR